MCGMDKLDCTIINLLKVLEITIKHSKLYEIVKEF